MTKLLVVEDEESFRDALDFMLRKEGYQVEVASDGIEALDKFDRDGPDLILLDIKFPLSLPSNQYAAFAVCPAGRIAPRSLIEIPIVFPRI